MKKACLTILITLSICSTIELMAQTGVEVSRPELSLKENGISIAYKLLNSSESEKFTIRIEITDSNSRIINAKSLSGDIGQHIPGGLNKEIFWDIEADSIFLDEEIFVQVYAQPEAPPVVEEAPTAVVEDSPVAEEDYPVADEDSPVVEEDPTVAEKDSPVVEENLMTEESSDKSAEDIGESPPPSTGKSFNRAGIIAQSALFPGLGLSRVNPGKPHWIKGVAAYGCVAGSIVLNRMAVTSYNSYKEPTSLNDVDNDYNKAVTQDVVSEVLIYAAIGIWVTDMVWTILGTSDLNKNQTSGNLKGFSIGTGVEPVSSVPLIALRYKF